MFLDLGFMGFALLSPAVALDPYQGDMPVEIVPSPSYFLGRLVPKVATFSSWVMGSSCGLCLRSLWEVLKLIQSRPA